MITKVQSAAFVLVASMAAASGNMAYADGFDDLRKGVRDVNCVFNPKDCESKDNDSANAASSESKSEPKPAPVASKKPSPKPVNQQVELEEVEVTSASASSHWGVHVPQRAFDGSEGSRWCSNYSQVKGQSLKLKFEDSVTLYQINLTVAQAKQNFLPKQLKLSFSNGTKQTIDLENSWGEHTIQVNPVKSKYVKIEFSELQDAKNRGTVCVNEVALFGAI